MKNTFVFPGHIVQLIKHVYPPDSFFFLQVFLLFYLKKKSFGGGMRRAHLLCLQGEHSFQKESRESQAEIHGENLGVKEGAVPSSTSGQNAYLGAGWDGEMVCTGGQMGSAP